MLKKILTLYFQIEVMLDYPNEYLTEVYGTYGDYMNRTMILSLTLKSNKKTHGPFGDATKGTYFSSLHGTDGGHYKIVGFHGRSYAYLNSIGFYLQRMRIRKAIRSENTSANKS